MCGGGGGRETEEVQRVRDSVWGGERETEEVQRVRDSVWGGERNRGGTDSKRQCGGREKQRRYRE